MHPILARPGAMLLYLSGWLAPAALVAYLLSVSSAISFVEAAASTGPACLLHAAVCLTPWYLCRVLPPDRTPVRRMLPATLVGATLGAGFFVLVSNAAASAFSGVFPGLGPQVAGQWPLLFGVALLFFLLSASVHYAAAAVERSREAESREMRAGIAAREAELRALKAQLSPHFLFNSLNSIASLAGTDPPVARDMCIRLADFFRGTLGFSESESVPLERELEMARNYLEIERVRFSGRLRFEQSISPGSEQCQVPSLLLQPLIENAIKHGISQLLGEGTVRLEARQEADGALTVTVENSFDPEIPPPRRSGMGLGLVRRRLTARYGSGATLETGAAGGRFWARVRIPCENVS